MSTALTLGRSETLADRLRKLGDVPPSRIRFYPYPGTATPEDVESINVHEGRLFELVDGILVEKAMGYRESLLTAKLIKALLDYVEKRKLGIVAGPDGMLQLASRLVRGPDVSFIAWKRLPGKKIPKEPIPNLAPNLAVEVLSKSNTIAEMKRKRREYFKAGVELIWVIDPRNRTIDVYTSPKNPTTLIESDALEGGGVLPGFKLPLRELFAILDAEGDE